MTNIALKNCRKKGIFVLDSLFCMFLPVRLLEKVLTNLRKPYHMDEEIWNIVRSSSNFFCHLRLIVKTPLNLKKKQTISV